MISSVARTAVSRSSCGNDHNRCIDEAPLALGGSPEIRSFVVADGPSPVPNRRRQNKSSDCHHAMQPQYRLAVGAIADTVPNVAVSKNPIVRGVYLTLGIISLGVAFVGAFLPLIPTTGPVILAAFFFARSSDRFDDWLETNTLFGGIVRDWRAGAGFSIRGKTIAVIAIIATFSVTILFAIESTVLRLLLVLLAASIATYIVTRPTKRDPAGAPAGTS